MGSVRRIAEKNCRSGKACCGDFFVLRVVCFCTFAKERADMRGAVKISGNFSTEFLIFRRQISGRKATMIDKFFRYMV